MKRSFSSRTNPIYHITMDAFEPNSYHKITSDVLLNHSIISLLLINLCVNKYYYLHIYIYLKPPIGMIIKNAVFFIPKYKDYKEVFLLPGILEDLLKLNNTDVNNISYIKLFLKSSSPPC